MFVRPHRPGRARGPIAALVIAASLALAVPSVAAMAAVCPMMATAAVSYAGMGHGGSGMSDGTMADCHSDDTPCAGLGGRSCCGDQASHPDGILAAPKAAPKRDSGGDTHLPAIVATLGDGHDSRSLRAAPTSEVHHTGPPSVSLRTDVLRR